MTRSMPAGSEELENALNDVVKREMLPFAILLAASVLLFALAMVGYARYALLPRAPINSVDIRAFGEMVGAVFGIIIAVVIVPTWCMRGVRALLPAYFEPVYGALRDLTSRDPYRALARALVDGSFSYEQRFVEDARNLEYRAILRRVL